MGLFALLAGCLGDSDNERSTDQQENDGQEETGRNESDVSTDLPEDLEIVVDFPLTVARGATVDCSVTIYNTGDDSVEYEIPVAVADETVDYIEDHLDRSADKSYDLRLHFDSTGHKMLEVGQVEQEVRVVASRDEWPALDTNNQNHYNGAYGPLPKISEKWSINQSEFIGSPAVYENTIYACEITDGNVSLNAIDLRDGETKWTKRLEKYEPNEWLVELDSGNWLITGWMKDYISQVSIDENRVYVAAKNLHAIDHSGDTNWSFQRELASRSVLHDDVPLVTTNYIYASIVGEGIFKINKESGEVIWYCNDAYADSRPVTDGDRLYCVGREQNSLAADINVTAVDIETGEVVWKTNTQIDELEFENREWEMHSSVSFTSVALSGGELYFGTSHAHDSEGAAHDGGPNGDLIGVNPETGNIERTVPSRHTFYRYGPLLPNLLGVRDLVSPSEASSAFWILTSDGLGIWSNDEDHITILPSGYDEEFRLRQKGVASVSNGLFIIINDQIWLRTRSRRLSSLEHDHETEGIKGIAAFEGLLIVTGEHGIVAFEG